MLLARQGEEGPDAMNNGAWMTPATKGRPKRRKTSCDDRSAWFDGGPYHDLGIICYEGKSAAWDGRT